MSHLYCRCQSSDNVSRHFCSTSHILTYLLNALNYHLDDNADDDDEIKNILNRLTNTLNEQEIQNKNNKKCQEKKTQTEADLVIRDEATMNRDVETQQVIHW